MCLYPRLIRNKKYCMYTTNKHKTLQIDDYRKQFVAIGCGECIECRKQKAREWQVRLNEEIKVWKYKYFVTLTFSAEELKKLCEEDKIGYTNVNTVAAIAVRRFCERWRKKNNKSVKHWLITELGHQGTERIHLHGLLFCDFPINNEYLNNIWKYGMTYCGEYCNEKTVNYIVKYVTKIDPDHKTYKADIFCSAGLGKAFLEKPHIKEKYKFNGKQTIQYYTLSNGQKIALPKYYRNKLFTQAERDQLWTLLLDSDKTYVRGIELRNISGKGYANYMRVLEEQQKINTQMGYGDPTEKWSEEDYKVTFDMVNKNYKRSSEPAGGGS